MPPKPKSNAWNVRPLRGVTLLGMSFMLWLSRVAALQGADEKVWQGCVLAMTGDERAPVVVRNASGAEVLDPYYAFDRKGLTLVDADYVLRTEGGLFYGENTREYLADALKNSGNTLTLMLYLHPRTLNQVQRGCVAAYGDPNGVALLALWQEKESLLLTLNGERPQTLKLLKLESLEPFHLAVVVSHDQVLACRNGASAATLPGYGGDMAKWPDGIPYFGNAQKGTAPWRGSIEFLELYNQALEPSALKLRYEHAVGEIKNRPARPVITFAGTLMARSEYPKPWDPGFTYSEVLSICEYSVEKVIAGEYSGKKIRVAEWMYVDRIFLTNSQKKIGSKHCLSVDQLDQRSNLTTTERADTLDLDVDAVVYYAPGPVEPLPPDQQPKGK